MPPLKSEFYTNPELAELNSEFQSWKRLESWGGPNSPPTAQPYSAVAVPVLMAMAEVTEPITNGR